MMRVFVSELLLYLTIVLLITAEDALHFYATDRSSRAMFLSNF